MSQLNNPVNDVRAVAMRLLATREHSTMELTRKLGQRGFDDADVAFVMEECTQNNYLSDERFTEMIINSRRGKGKGPSHILKELQEHKIDADLISLYLDMRDTEWVGYAAKAREKKYGKEIPNDFKEKMQQARFLEYRGFSSDHIFAVLENGG